ncbi:MAG TPA: GNAT family N-acetyltransferase [Jatrophihabitans sp.]
MSRTGVRVRPAEAADALELARIVRNFSSLTHVGTPQATHESSLEHLAERIGELVDDPARSVLVAADDNLFAKDGGTLVGVLVARPDEIGALDLTPAMYVSHLIVTKDARRRGVGRALLAIAVQVAEERGFDRMVATAASGSREANRYFARLGFAPLVVQRVASTATLRRSLGISDAPSRLAVLRRSRARSMSSGLPRLRA